MARQLKGIYNLHSDGQIYFTTGYRMENWLGFKGGRCFTFERSGLDDDYRESLAKDKQLGPIQLVKWRD